MKIKNWVISGLLAGVFVTPVTGFAQQEEAMGTLASGAWKQESIYSERSEKDTQKMESMEKLARKDEKKTSHLAMSRSMDDE